MIHEERLCMGCHLPIQDMRHGVLVPDGGGTGQVYHRACLEQMVGEATTSDEPRASVRMLPSRPRSDRDFIRIKPLVRATDGTMVHPDELHKSDSSQPMYEASKQCILCHRIVPDSDAVRSGSSVGHKECVRVLLEFVNQSEPEKPVQGSKQAATSVYPVQVKAGGEWGEEDRLAREDARYLLRTLADLVRAQEVD